MEMTSRERVLCALNIQEPDMVPIFDFIYSRKLYQEVLGHTPAYYSGEDAALCAAKIGYDLAVVPLGGFGGIRDHGLDSNTYQDEWGTTYKKDEKYAWPADAPIAFPIKTREDWQNFRVPDPNRQDRLKEIEKALKVGREYNLAIAGSIRGPFTGAWLLLGIEEFSMLLYDDPDFLDEILTVVTDFNIKGGLRLIEVGVDAIVFADDYGTINGPFMSPTHFGKHIIPQLQRLIQAFDQRDIPVIMHSDGNVRMLLDQIIPLGINGYHPVEKAAGMVLAEIKQSFGSKICPIGNVDNKSTLVTGSVAVVQAATIECLKAGAPGGGYILASDHSVKDDIPNENIFAVYETGRRYGTYPFDPFRLP